MTLEFIRSSSYSSAERKETVSIPLKTVCQVDHKWREEGLKIIFCGLRGFPSYSGCADRHPHKVRSSVELWAPYEKVYLHVAQHPDNWKLPSPVKNSCARRHPFGFLLCSPTLPRVWEELLFFKEITRGGLGYGAITSKQPLIFPKRVTNEDSLEQAA